MWGSPKTFLPIFLWLQFLLAFSWWSSFRLADTTGAPTSASRLSEMLCVCASSLLSAGSGEPSEQAPPLLCSLQSSTWCSWYPKTEKHRFFCFFSKLHNFVFPFALLPRNVKPRWSFRNCYSRFVSSFVLKETPAVPREFCHMLLALE